MNTRGAEINRLEPAGLRPMRSVKRVLRTLDKQLAAIGAEGGRPWAQAPDGDSLDQSR